MTSKDYNHPKLFFRNIPDFPNSKLIAGYEKVLESYDKPLIIWGGTNHCPIENYYLSQDSIKKIKKEGLVVVIHEPMAYRNKDPEKDFGYKYYSEFKSDIDFSEIVSDEADSFEHFAQINKLENVKLITRDMLCENIQKNYRRIKIVYFNSTENLEYDYDAIPKPTIQPVEKKFHFAVNRYTPARHLVMAYLAGRNGKFSWPFEANLNHALNAPWLDLSYFEESLLEKLKQGNDILNSDSQKYFIDRPREKLRVESTYDVKIVEKGNSLFKNSEKTEFVDSFSNCFSCVVPETRFAQPFPHITEKSIYPLIYGLPYLIVGPPKSLVCLNWNGCHKTYPELWNESYDQETNHTKRLLKIFEIIDYIDSFSEKDLEKMKKSVLEKLEHNKKVYKWKTPNTQKFFKNL